MGWGREGAESTNCGGVAATSSVRATLAMVRRWRGYEPKENVKKYPLTST